MPPPRALLLTLLLRLLLLSCVGTSVIGTGGGDCSDVDCPEFWNEDVEAQPREPPPVALSSRLGLRQRLVGGGGDERERVEPSPRSAADQPPDPEPPTRADLDLDLKTNLGNQVSIKAGACSNNKTSSSCPDGKWCVSGRCACPAIKQRGKASTSCAEDPEEARGDRMWHPMTSTKLGDMAHIPELDLVGQQLTPMNGTFKSCAVVGSSVSLRKQSWGKAIDQHDTVVRFNEAPVRRFEDKVGSKTTLRIQCVRACGYSESDAEHCLIYQNAHLCSPKRMKRCRMVEPRSPKTLAMPGMYFARVGVSQALIKKDPAARQRKGPPRIISRLSSGFFAVLLMSNMCERVDVYGFTHGGGADHYYDHKGYEKGMRKPWQMKHHWTIERFAFNQLRDGALPNVKVH